MLFAILIVNKGRPGDYVISSGNLIKVKDLVEAACQEAEIDSKEIIHYQQMPHRSDIQLGGDNRKMTDLTKQYPKIVGKKLMKRLYYDENAGEIQINCSIQSVPPYGICKEMNLIDWPTNHHKFKTNASFQAFEGIK